MTGTNDNRPDFRQMIEDSKKHQWQIVLVYKFDRFSRNKYETTKHKKTLKDNGVKVVSATEYIPDSPEAIILESMFEGYAEYYSAELSQKIRRGMRETRLKELYHGGGLPYGYKINKQKIVIDESEAEIVRYIYQEYAKGIYVREIIDNLNDKCIYHKGKPFAQNTIYGILKNEKYSGVYRYKDEVFYKTYPQIISPDIYSVVRLKIDKNRYGKRSVKTEYLLRSKLTCGYCGRPIVAETGTAKNGNVIRYYKCKGRKTDHNGCLKSQVRKEFLEELITNAIIKEMSKPDIINKIVATLLKIQEKATINHTLSMLINEKRKVDKALDNIVKAIENGASTRTTIQRLKELEQQQDNLEKEIIIERSRHQIKISENEMRKFYKEALKFEPKMLIEQLVKEIILYEDKVKIIFNNPTRLDLDESQGFSFGLIAGNLHYKKPNTPKLKTKKMLIEMFIC